MASHPTNCACDFCRIHMVPLSISAMDQELIAPSLFPQMREGQLSFGRLDITITFRIPSQLLASGMPLPFTQEQRW